MWMFHIWVDGEEGPEDRYVGPFPSEEELEEFIEAYEMDSDWYAKLIPPDKLLHELVVIQ